MYQINMWPLQKLSTFPSFLKEPSTHFELGEYLPWDEDLLKQTWIPPGYKPEVLTRECGFSFFNTASEFQLLKKHVELWGKRSLFICCIKCRSQWSVKYVDDSTVAMPPSLGGTTPRSHWRFGSIFSFFNLKVELRFLFSHINIFYCLKYIQG